ncbi:hypothetical protein [Halothiobacillus sp.]|uniref:hypothetical protein n=1 Tax=Halothiobacillus sp. TaxID=1891311 RepID=UPI002AD553C7|nr:hypothetical protein [Halothiobacillus sp.]
MNNIYDTILWLKSESTGKQFPVVLFSADTDMATAGWVTLTSIEKYEVVVSELTAEEYRATANGSSGYLQVEKRINAALGRADLKCPWFVRAEESGPSGKNLSFQEFKKVYRPPAIYYRDIFQPDAVAVEVSRVSLSQFEQAGGKLVVVQ